MGCGASFYSLRPEWSSFTQSEMIGEGSYGTIWRTTHARDKTQYAAKVISIDQCISRCGGADVLKSEITALKRITHHALIYLLEGGDLRYHLNDHVDFTESDVAFIGACIASALSHIHSCGVIHRDVKPENIVLDCQGYPRLTDFGISYTATSSFVCTASSGTVGYLAPEVLSSSHAHSFESDFWSLGVVMFELLFSQRPFERNCPKNFISFVEETYKDLWCMDRYSNANNDGDITVTTTRTCFDEFSFKSKDNYNMSDTVEEYQNSKHMISIPLPKSMMIKMPIVSQCDNPVSAEFVSVIRGLMDVRVPQRLGAWSNITSLQRRLFFCALDWQDLIQKKITSPLHVDVNITRVCLDLKYANRTKTEAKPVNLSKLPPRFRYILSMYSQGLNNENTSKLDTKGCTLRPE